jgi:hypothetical protein
MGVMTLDGKIQTWGLGEDKDEREYIVVTVPYREARALFKSEPYSAATGKGEQRGILPGHVRKIRKAMEAGDFTPASVTVGLRPHHRGTLTYQAEDGVRVAVLTLEEGDTLPLTDGGHRFEALEQIRRAAEEALQAGAEGEAREQARRRLERVDAQPITVMLLLDGDPQNDFINLQKGKAVDAAHMFSLKVSRNADPSDKNAAALKLAFNVAKLLHTNKDSDFHKQVRFDSKSFAPYPVSSLCPKGSSDLGTSLLGLARVGLARGNAGTPEWLAYSVVGSAKALHESAPELLGLDRVLTPPPDGTRGAASMLIGLGVAMAYRMSLEGSTLPTPRDKAQLVEAARDTLDRGVNGNFSGPAKRALLGSFVREFFADLDVSKHEGIPLGLIRILSASAFGASPLPKQGKAKGLPDWAGEEETAEPDQVKPNDEVVAADVPEPPDDAEETPPSHDLDVPVPEAKPDDCVVAATENPCQAEQEVIRVPQESELEPADVACMPEPPNDAPAAAAESLCRASEPSVGTNQGPSYVVADVTDPANLERMRASFQSNYGAADQTLCLVMNGQDIDAGVDLVRSWGYEYKKLMTIAADSRRKWAQHCIVAVRGQPQRTDYQIPDIIHEKSPQHRQELLRVAKRVCGGCVDMLFITGQYDGAMGGCFRLDERRLAG